MIDVISLGFYSNYLSCIYSRAGRNEGGTVGIIKGLQFEIVQNMSSDFSKAKPLVV